jgi:hypothetical protein
VHHLTDREGRGGESVLPDRVRKDWKVREDEEKGKEKKGRGWREANQ